MNKSKISLGRGNKLVWPSDPYRPAATAVSELVGRSAELKLITAAWMAGPRTLPLAPLLVGEPGVGKNRLVYELARITRRDLYIFQGHEDVAAEDLACAVRFSDSRSRGMDYVLSPLITAMLEGAICFIDEIAKIRPRALALLVSVLDERRYIDSSLLGERVHARPGFRFIAATNTGEINSLPEFIRSRMRPVVKVGHPPKEEINEIISRYHGDEQNLGAILDAFWDLWLAGKRRPTPRDAIHHFALASSLRDCESAGAPDAPTAAADQVRSLETPTATKPIEPAHLRAAFEHLFQEAA